MSSILGNLVPILYLISAVLFILGLKGMTKIRSARRGNALAALAMLIAVIATLIDLGLVDYRWIIAGLIIGSLVGAVAAIRVEMTAMPEMVALFNGCGGGASALVAISFVWVDIIEPGHMGTAAAVLEGGVATSLTVFLSILIGGVTLSGSVVAFLKLNGTLRGRPAWLKARNVVNTALGLVAVACGVYLSLFAATPEALGWAAIVLTTLSLVLGILMVWPIGGADMPVVISLLNSFSGMAAAATGFVLMNNLLIISGALVGASGLILTLIMCRAMNRTLAHVLFADFGDEDVGDSEYGQVRSFSAEEAALVLEAAESVIFVPGYGLAVAQAQHTVKEVADLLAVHGTKVRYAIHPVAGRMPGHMNVLLAEADVPYEQLVEMERIDSEFKTTDVVVVVGANDVVNPAADTQPNSPVYGMPILHVAEAKTVIVIKRSLSPGYAGIKNELFEYENTMMLFSDAKQALQEIVAELKELATAA